LEQNYPNPFNPSTNINFKLAKTGFTTLKVYNILGQEIAVLVNEKLKLGNYSYEFNAENLNSGLYFYKLQTNEFSDTKKMMLIE